MADFTGRNADETKEYILTFDENGGSPAYTKIEDANGADRTDDVVELLGINDKEDADSTILKEGDVEDNLNSTSTTKPLSANQGKQLNDDKASLPTSGSWSPTLIANGTDFDEVVYETQYGIWIQQDKKMYVHGELRTSSVTKGSASGDIAIGGVPNVPSVTPFGFSGSLTRVASWGGDKPTEIEVRTSQWVLGTTSGRIKVNDVGTGTNSNRIIFDTTYIID